VSEPVFRQPAPGPAVGQAQGQTTPSAEPAQGLKHSPEPARLNVADSRWGELLDLDARLFKDKGVRLLTPEARVLLFLTLSGPVPVTAAMQVAGTSYRGFYTVLERLKQAGLVAAAKDEHDHRVRRLKLDPSLALSPVAR
jgi:hypothetical protein